MQAALKAVLEPVFEADFVPAPYGFRPNRRAHDAIAEIVYLAQRGTVSWFDAEARTVRYDVVGGEDRDLRKCGSVGQTSGRPPAPTRPGHPPDDRNTSETITPQSSRWIRAQQPPRQA